MNYGRSQNGGTNLFVRSMFAEQFDVDSFDVVNLGDSGGAEQHRSTRSERDVA